MPGQKTKVPEINAGRRYVGTGCTCKSTSVEASDVACCETTRVRAGNRLFAWLMVDTLESATQLVLEKKDVPKMDTNVGLEFRLATIALKAGFGR
jgi:hypothetical protein